MAPVAARRTAAKLNMSGPDASPGCALPESPANVILVRHIVGTDVSITFKMS